MNIGRKRIRVDHIPKDHIIFEQLTDETVEYNTNPSNFEYSEDEEYPWKYGDRIVYMGENQLDCYIAGYIGYNNKLTHTPPSEFKYGPSPCPGDHELYEEDEEDELDEEDEEYEEDEEDEQYGGKKSRNRKSRKREKKSKNRKTSKERKSRKFKKMKPRKKMSKKRKSRKNKPRKNKSTRKH